MILYFETSAVNYACSTLSIGDAIATRAFQETRGRSWVISPVVVHEILLTGDDLRREELIHFCQRLFSRELLPSPEEFLIRYIEDGCPATEAQRSLLSSSQLAGVWRDLVDAPDRTFVFDKAHVKAKAVALAGLTRDLHRITRHRQISLAGYGLDVSLDLLLEKMTSLVSSLHVDARSPGDSRTHCKLAIFYALLLLCAEVGPDPEPVMKFWRRIGVHHIADRMHYLLLNHSCLVHRGPLAWMARMTKIQCEGKFSRGVYWDSLHAMYITYVTNFLAEDAHFVALKDSLPSFVNSTKIVQPSKLEWAYEQRTNVLQDSVFRT